MKFQISQFNRCKAFALFLRAASAAAAIPAFAAAPQEWKLTKEDEVLLNSIEFRCAQFFLRETDPVTGLVPDRVAASSNDTRRFESCSVAGGGFGLSALCIAESRGWMPRTVAVVRARAMLDFALEKAPHERGFLYHFLDHDTGRRIFDCEVSPIDTAIFLCGALAAKQHFGDRQLSARVDRFYERIEWPWMLNGGDTLCLGWKPETGFSRHRWHGYAEHMAMYLLAIGSRKHPISPECWHGWRREPVGSYAGNTFIMYPPLFVHQYAHAFVDFRGLSDDYADYWQNSVFATLANRQMCLDMSSRFSKFGPDLWGITSSDSPRGYRDWGGPPETPDIDGTVVPCAAGGSLPFAPRECIATLRVMKERYGDQIWNRYGFADAFNPHNGWTSPDVLAIDAGIMLVMIENLRSELVWDSFMKNPEVARAMQLAGFRPAPVLASNTSLLDKQRRPPARRDRLREAVATPIGVPEFHWDWRSLDVFNARESVADGDGKISARFAFGWDTNVLRVLAAVTDPDLVSGDKLELYLDPENDGFRWGDYRDFLFNFSLTNDCVESLGRNINRVSVTATNNGYRIIAEIPWRQLNIEPRLGLTIGCSPGVYSVSRLEEPAVKLNWQWRDEPPAIRLGTLTLAEP